ncbi:MAG: ResB-like family cytochrome C biogenesis protein [Geobacter sp.]|nr:MAG: ResB-like family cytochrome C biogenesis protein [Geobacter sp.]
MNMFKRFFLSRNTIISLIISALFAITLAAFIPQGFLASSDTMLAWQAAHPFLERCSKLLGLHHIYTHPLFSMILAGVTVSLALSAWNQCLAAWRRTFHPDDGIAGGERFVVPGTMKDSWLILAANGYLRQGTSNGSMRLVRHPWGYWGNTLLHVGIVVTIGASLFIALTQQRGIIQLAEGAVHNPSDPMLMEEHGFLVKPLVLPDTIRLDRVTYSFWPSNGIRQIESQLSFLSDTGTIETKNVEINSILHHRGIRFYQGVEFGHAFFVEVTGQNGLNRIFQLQIQHPEAPDRPSYNDFQDLLGDGYLVRAKYLVDAEKKSFRHVNPLLTLRLDKQGKELGQIPLRVGEEGAIGPYSFRLKAVTPWSRLIIVDLTGMPGIFLGFFIICLGGLLHYFTPPRELSLHATTGGDTAVCWRAAKFSGFYQDELASLKTALGYEEIHG